ncbi:MAG: hypothetical protein J2P46_09030, partial [Zavarzinella sp.]|nr:hypothetical protein [Zavarzinella sp.]
MTRRYAPRSPRRLRLEALEARLAPSNSPVLIADIAPGGADSSPSSFTGMSNFVYFAASTGTANSSTIGEELWRTDVTTGATTLVADIYPGGSGVFVHSSSPRNLTAVGNTLFFTATDGTTGTELWKSDGTAAGTVLVKDIRPGSNSSNPAMLTAVGNTLYFTATDATTGTELWKSDGTAAGTVEVADLTPGSTNTTFEWLKDIGGRLVFARQESSFGGNPTVDVFAVDPGGLTPIVSYAAEAGVAVVGTRLFYHAFTPDSQDTLFVIDTAAVNPTPVLLTAVPTNLFGAAQMRYLTAVGNRLFFDAITAVGEEPWVSDGTPGGTHLVKDINQDTAANNPGSSPTEFTNVGGITYFAATTIAHGRELWRTDGTDAGTWEVADLALGDTSSSPSELVSLGGRLLFDTTVAGNATLQAYDPAADQFTAFPGHTLMQPGFLGATFYPYAVYDDVLYMAQKVAADNVGVEPYKLEFDPVAPTISGFDVDTGVPGDGVTADATPRLFGTATANARVRVYDQTTLVGSTTAGPDGHWEITTAPLADGPHALRARTVKLNGTESANSNSLALTIDATAPDAPVVTGFADNSGSPADNVTNDPTITLSGTAEPNATVRVSGDLTDLGEVLAGADGSWSFAPGSLADGSHSFTAAATDSAGNVSSPSLAFLVVIDTVAPAVPTITGFADDSGAPGDGLTDDPTPTLRGTAEPGTVVTVSDGLTVLGTTAVGAGGDWQFTTPSLADGPHAFTAVATDMAGNASSSSSPLALSIDTARPTVTIEQAAGQSDPTNVSSIAFHVTFSKPVTGFTAAAVDLTASSVGGTLVADVTGSGTDYTVTVTGMAGEGTVVASILAGAAADAAGNGNTASTSTDNSVGFDSVAPTVTINQAPGQADPTDGTQIVFAVQFSEPVTGFTADDVSFAGSAGAGTLAAAVSGSGADYTVTVTGMAGAQTVVASIPAGAAVDATGNASLDSTSTDNTVSFNDIGILEFSLARF